jgi:hypothetical protein
VAILQPVSAADDRLGSKCEELEPSIRMATDTQVLVVGRRSSWPVHGGDV